MIIPLLILQNSITRSCPIPYVFLCNYFLPPWYIIYLNKGCPICYSIASDRRRKIGKKIASFVSNYVGCISAGSNLKFSNFS
jgi:hypothetical protein